MHRSYPPFVDPKSPVSRGKRKSHLEPVLIDTGLPPVTKFDDGVVDY